MKARKNNGKLEKIEVSNEEKPTLKCLEVLDKDYLESFNEADCKYFLVFNKKGYCRRTREYLSEYPCLPECPYHKQKDL